MNEARTTEELLHLELPKWPQCIITGTKIPEDQALEIIRRTDCCFKSGGIFGNDKEYNHWLETVLHLPDDSMLQNFDSIAEYWKKEHEWHDKWGFIFLRYLDNDWINSCMAQGVQGWCHPDGEIGYFYNIGKWPEVYEVLEELELIASNFSFLELECTLMSDEYGEYDSHPIVSFLVREGEVEVVDPEVRNLHEEFHRHVPTPGEVNDLAFSRFHQVINSGYDSAISRDTIRKWGERMAE